MKKPALCGIALAMAAFFAIPPNLAPASLSKLDEATAVIQEIQAIPETGIPPQLFSDAHGMAVIPGLLKAGFIVGVRYGTGVFTANHGGRWSAPVFVKLGGLSAGFQLGAESTDLILVFRTERSIRAFKSGKLTLGADVAVAAGPVGRHAEAAIDIEKGAEVYAYSRSRGLFGGVAIESAALAVEDDANTAFYGRPVSADEILAGGVNAPEAAANFSELLQRYSGGPKY